MKRLLIFLTLLALVTAPLLLADTETSTERTERAVRLYYVKALFAEKHSIYRLFGYPPQRIRTNVDGVVREKWTYPELNVEFTFDMEGKITMIRRLLP